MKTILVMFRYNPQLGTYCTIEEANIVKSTTKTRILADGKKFDNEGNQRAAKAALYGSAEYKLFTEDEAKQLYDGVTFNGYRTSQGIRILETL